MTIIDAVDTIDYDQLYIGGHWAPPSSQSRISVISPANGILVGSTPAASQADIDCAVSAARRAFDDPQGWPSWSPKRRAEVLERFALALESRGEEMARRVSIQNGMPISLARQFEAGFPPLLLRFYSTMMESTPSEEIRKGLFGGATVVTLAPVGVVAAIVPWNVPQALTFMKLAPALAAGCTVVLKPSTETVLDAFLMAEAAIEAGMPAGVLNVVPGDREAGAYLVAHPGVDKVAFTGSTAAGRSIGQVCGGLLRPVTLELGGKSAAIILDDADLQSNVDTFFASTLINNGQVCWLGSRILAPESRYKEIVDIVTDMASSLTIGDPLDDSTQVGPLVSERQRNRVEDYIMQGRSSGAALTTGGKRPSGFDKGWYVEPTVFANVAPDDAIAQEEIFGPVLSVIPYSNEDHAVAIANNSQYGLGGSVWTSDPERGAELARKIQTGTVGINGYTNDPTAPFGGIKNSGLGQELGPEGLKSYQQLKSIYLDISAR
jgi:aldehyde dehydrogenase (NAD+)